jgi:hypothetical protein
VRGGAILVQVVADGARLRLGVAVQAAFERQTLKPAFSLDILWVMGLKGYRLWVMG